MTSFERTDDRKQYKDRRDHHRIEMQELMEEIALRQRLSFDFTDRREAKTHFPGHSKAHSMKICY